MLRPLHDAGVITYIQNDRNYERSYSRNVGFRKAKGDYVTLLDSDDVIYPDCLADAAVYITEHPGTRFFHCLYEYISEEYKPVHQVALVFRPLDNPFKELMKGNIISNIGVFYTKELVQKVQFDENPVLTGSEDYDFVIRVLAETRSIGRINKVNAGVLIHPHRTGSLDEWEPAKKRIDLFLNKQLNSPDFLKTYGAYKHIFISNIQLYLSSFVATRGHTGRGLKFWLKALRYDFSLIFKRKFWLTLIIIIKYTFR
jgi:glycosyltransferase involved in cell wall biosynthesis